MSIADRAVGNDRGEPFDELDERASAWGASHGLTPTEVVVARHSIRGLSNKEIANALGVAPSTVRTHLLNLFRKVRVSTRGELAYHFFSFTKSAPSRSDGRDDPWRLLVDGVREYAIIMLDTEGRVVTWNTGAERLMGYTGAEVVGSHFSVFLTPEDAARGKAEAALREAVARGEFKVDGWRVRKDGSRFFAYSTLTPLRDAAGRHQGFAKVVREHRRTVLVLDDDEALRTALCLILERAGYSAVGASDGCEALEFLSAGERKPSLILLDLTMPRMNGWQFREWQLKHPVYSLVPVVISSAAEDLAARAKELGAAGYLSKPIVGDALRAAVERFCDAPEQGGGALTG